MAAIRYATVGQDAVQITNMKSTIVSTKDSELIGFLFIDSPDYLVVANSVVEGSLVGPIKQNKVRFIDTEADFVILPREKVRGLRFLK